MKVKCTGFSTTDVNEERKAQMFKRIMWMVAIIVAAAAADSRAGDVTWSGTIKGLVEARCVRCHGDEAAPEYQAFKKEKEKWQAKGQGMRMDTYSHLIFYTAWPDTGALMRRLDDGRNTKDGKPGNMYQHLGATEEERQKNLALFKEWVGTWVLKRLPEITGDELSGIRVPY
jgi:single heme cytochrome PccH